MNGHEHLNNNLTIMDRDTDWYLEGLPTTIANIAESDVFVRAKLSNVTRQIMERHYSKQQAKKKPRKPTKARGRYHHNRKKLTKKLLQKRRWKDNPFGCIIHGFGAYSIDKALFMEHIAPLWESNDPALLRVKKHRKSLDGELLGTSKNPYTVYSLIISHPTKGVLFDGQSQQIYDLSV